jgi:tetratricopeptide (TPR) repeat protein
MKIKYCLTFIFLCVTYLISAQEYHYLDSAKKYDSQNEFVKASVFYERVLFGPAGEQDLYDAFFFKIESLKKQQAFLSAVQFIKQNINLIENDSVKNKVYKQWILCSFLNSQYDEAISLVELSKNYFAKYVDYKWVNFLKILSLNNQNNWVEAKNTYKTWLIDLKMDTALAEQRYQKLPKLKSENTASWLATIIPGAGQIYTKNYLEAFASISLQTIGILYGINSFQNKYFLSSWLVGLGTFGSFHFGGVRRSVELVKQYNKKKSSDFNEKLKLVLIDQLNNNN